MWRPGLVIRSPAGSRRAARVCIFISELQEIALPVFRAAEGRDLLMRG
jgi:hypothetical protein